MVKKWLQKNIPYIGLAFIGLFLIMGSIPVSRYNGNSSHLQHSQPNAAFGETPFDTTAILHDSGFEGDTWWNYTRGANVTSYRNETFNRGSFNHTSAPTGEGLQQLRISNATYAGDNVTGLVDIADTKNYVTVKNDLSLIHYIFDVFFPENLKSGDIITIVFTSPSNYNCSIYVRNNGSRNDPTYGNGTYTTGSSLYVNITLTGLTAPRSGFNLDFYFQLVTQSARVDQVLGWTTANPKSFTSSANINQTFSTTTDYDVAYEIECTGNVSAYQNVQSATLYLQINGSNIWSQIIGGVVADTHFSIQLPHDTLQRGGNFVLIFSLTLSIYTSAAVNFLMFIDDVFLNETPNTNLLDDSPIRTGTPWHVQTNGIGYYGGFSTENQYLGVAGYNPQTVGGANVSQTFATNSTQSNFTLVFNYYVRNMTNINHMNITVSFNDTLAGGLTGITQTTSTWVEFRLNSTPLEQHRNYVLNITLRVQPEVPGNCNWVCLLDNIYLYPNWGRDLSQIGAYDANIYAGQIKDVYFQYNATGIPNTSISDANVTIFDNDTGVVWGYDIYGSTKFQVINFGNGTYNMKISTVGFTTGLYNLLIVFYRANFPDTGAFIQLNIGGSELNITFSSGAHFDDENQIWFVNEDNLPYVEDTTKNITIFVVDNIARTPITGAFVEARLSLNTLSWTEVWKTTGSSADWGYYTIFLDTRGLNPYPQYLQLNFSLRVTAENFSARQEIITTIVKPLPTALAVEEIESFYEGSTFQILVIFQDTFHFNVGIDEATISWLIVEKPTEFNGYVDFRFSGVYISVLPLNSLGAGNYTLGLIGEKLNYETSYLNLPIEVLPKYNVSISLSCPSEFMEGNSYQVTYNFTYTELGGPLIGESINFLVKYQHAGTQEYYNLFTSDIGIVTVTIAVPWAETEVNITATYGGKTNVSTTFNSTKIPVIRLYEVLINIITTDFAPELVGGTSVEIRAILTYENSTPVVGATLVFRVSTSETIVVTDATGLARALVLLPTEGSFYIQVIYEGTSMIQDTSKQGALLTIISPATAFMNQIIQYAIYIGIIVAIALGTYIGVSRGVVRPRQRARQVEYVGLMNRFEDARNIQLLMIINRESGAEIFSKALSGVPVDPTLVSGFLQAITSFGKELLAEDKVEAMHGPKTFLAKTKGKAEVRVLEFHHFKIVLEETVHIRIALLLLKNPSPRLLKALHKFAEQSEKRFGSQVDQLRGRQLTDEDTWELIEECFEPSLIYVHMTDLVNARLINPTKWEKVVLEEIQKAPFNGEAYLDTLQEQIAHRHIGKELEIVDAGLSLRRKNVLIALSPRYMEVRLSIRKAIDALPVAAKDIILTVGDGEMDSNKILEKVKLPQEEYAALVQQLQDLGILTEKFKLDLPGKLVYTTLKVGADTLKK